MRVTNEILVEESFTCCCAAETGDTIRAADLTLEFVVVGEFLICDMLVAVQKSDLHGDLL